MWWDGGNWVVGWAKESRKGDHCLSYPQKTVCSTAKHRMFSSKTCLSAGQLFITSTDKRLGTSCRWKKSAIRSLVLYGLWPHEFASICLFLSTELAILHGSTQESWKIKPMVNLWHDNKQDLSKFCNLAFSFSNNKVFCLHQSLLVRAFVPRPSASLPRRGGGGFREPGRPSMTQPL